MMRLHEKLENNSILLLIGILVTVAIGGIVEVVPLFTIGGAAASDAPKPWPLVVNVASALPTCSVAPEDTLMELVVEMSPVALTISLPPVTAVCPV